MKKLRLIRSKREPLRSILVRKSKDLLGLERVKKEAISSLYSKDGRRIIFIHNPKVAGSSLKDLIKVKGQTHALAREVCNKRAWKYCSF